MCPLSKGSGSGVAGEWAGLTLRQNPNPCVSSSGENVFRPGPKKPNERVMRNSTFFFITASTETHITSSRFRTA